MPNDSLQRKAAGSYLLPVSGRDWEKIVTEIVAELPTLSIRIGFDYNHNMSRYEQLNSRLGVFREEDGLWKVMDVIHDSYGIETWFMVCQIVQKYGFGNEFQIASEVSKWRGLCYKLVHLLDKEEEKLILDDIAKSEKIRPYNDKYESTKWSGQLEYTLTFFMWRYKLPIFTQALRLISKEKREEAERWIRDSGFGEHFGVPSFILSIVNDQPVKKEK